MGLTEDQKKMIGETWLLVKTSGTLEDRGREMFLRLFDENPELLPLFPFADEDTPEKLRNSDRLRRHGIRVMTTIDEAIAGLDDMETVAARLSALGERHAHYEARKAHFQHVGVALIWVLETNLGDRWIPDVKDSWVTLFEVITEVMGEKLP